MAEGRSSSCLKLTVVTFHLDHKGCVVPLFVKFSIVRRLSDRLLIRIKIGTSAIMADLRASKRPRTNSQASDISVDTIDFPQYASNEATSCIEAEVTDSGAYDIGEPPPLLTSCCSRIQWFDTRTKRDLPGDVRGKQPKDTGVLRLRLVESRRALRR